MMPFPRDMIPLMPCEYMPLFQKIYVWDVYFLFSNVSIPDKNSTTSCRCWHKKHQDKITSVSFGSGMDDLYYFDGILAAKSWGHFMAHHWGWKHMKPLEHQKKMSTVRNNRSNVQKFINHFGLGFRFQPWF